MIDDDCPTCNGRGWQWYPVRYKVSSYVYADTPQPIPAGESAYRGLCQTCFGTRKVICPVSASELEEVLRARCSEADHVD